MRYSIDLYTNLEQETGQRSWINKGSLSIATNDDRIFMFAAGGACRIVRYAGRNSTLADAERWPLMNSDDIVGLSGRDDRVSARPISALRWSRARVPAAPIFGARCDRYPDLGNHVVGVETERGAIGWATRCRPAQSRGGGDGRRRGADGRATFHLLTKPVHGAEGNLPTLSDHDGHLYIRDDSGELLIWCSADGQAY